MAQKDYMTILDRAQDIVFALMRERKITKNLNAEGFDVLPLIPEVNERLHDQFPEFASGRVTTRMVRPLPHRGLGFWQLEFVVFDEGKEIGRQLVDYDAAPLRPWERELLRQLGVALKPEVDDEEGT